VWECSRGKTVAEETLKALRDGHAIMCSRCGKLSYDLEDVRLGYCRDCR
jgi:ribosomal protein L37E